MGGSDQPGKLILELTPEGSSDFRGHRSSHIVLRMNKALDPVTLSVLHNFSSLRRKEREDTLEWLKNMVKLGSLELLVTDPTAPRMYVIRTTSDKEKFLDELDIPVQDRAAWRAWLKAEIEPAPPAPTAPDEPKMPISDKTIGMVLMVLSGGAMILDYLRSPQLVKGSDLTPGLLEFVFTGLALSFAAFLHSRRQKDHDLQKALRIFIEKAERGEPFSTTAMEWRDSQNGFAADALAVLTRLWNAGFWSGIQKILFEDIRCLFMN